jgi:hypothetical protein
LKKDLRSHHSPWPFSPDLAFFRMTSKAAFAVFGGMP